MQIMHLRYGVPISKMRASFRGFASSGPPKDLPLTPLCNSFKELFKESALGSFFLSAIFGPLALDYKAYNDISVRSRW